MTLVMSCGHLSQSYAGRSIGEECVLPVAPGLDWHWCRVPGLHGHVSDQDYNASHAAQGVVDCLAGCGLPTAPLPPRGRQRLALPCRRVSATSSLDL